MQVRFSKSTFQLCAQVLWRPPADDASAVLGADEHVRHVYLECVAEYPKVFIMGENRKSGICKRALLKVKSPLRGRIPAYPKGDRGAGGWL